MFIKNERQSIPSPALSVQVLVDAQHSKDLLRLRRAVKRSEREVDSEVLQLLDQGVDPFERYRGRSAVQVAIDQFRMNALWKMLRHHRGAEQAAPEDLRSAVRQALKLDRWSISTVVCLAAVIAKHDFIKAWDSSYCSEGSIGRRAVVSPLHCAAMIGLTEQALALLELGYEPFSTHDASHTTPLALALACKHKDTHDAMSAWVARQEAQQCLRRIPLVAGSQP